MNIENIETYALGVYGSRTFEESGGNKASYDKADNGSWWVVLTEYRDIYRSYNWCLLKASITKLA